MTAAQGLKNLPTAQHIAVTTNIRARHMEAQELVYLKPVTPVLLYVALESKNRHAQFIATTMGIKSGSLYSSELIQTFSLHFH